MKEKTIPETAQKLIDHYAKLKLGGKEVVCPYFMNLSKSKDLRAMVGKGTPEEIEMEAHMWEKLKGVDFKEMKPIEIKEFLMARSIGIDCAAFIIHVLNGWFKSAKGYNIWRELKLPNKNFFNKIAYMLKPVEKLGAEIISNKENAKEISINEVLPGDVVRLKWKRKNSHHILLISRIEYNDDGTVSLIEYSHSKRLFDTTGGISVGQIRITDQNLPLEKQEWLEVDEYGVCPVLEGYMINLEDNGLRRINAMADLVEKI